MADPLSLTERRRELLEAVADIQAKAKADGRDVTDDEAREGDLKLDEADKLLTRYKQEQRFNAAKAELFPETAGDVTNRITKPADPNPGDHVAPTPVNIRVGKERIVDHPKLGFRSMGDFATAVIHSSMPGAPVHENLRASLSTFGSELSGADGAFAVPPDFRADIMEKVNGEESLVPMTDQLTTGTNNLTVPKDETTPWQTSGGILANWVNESGAITQSKPSLETVTLKLHKLAVIVPITDELQSDASALNGWLSRKAPMKIAFELNRVIIQGAGAGQPLGILNSAHTVSVAKTASQDADTVVAQNLIDMYARLYAPWRRNAVWLMNQDVEPMLLSMSLPGKDITGTAVTGYGGLIYMPPGGLSATPYGTLFGRPVIPTQACETLGDKGDIFFADLKQYVTVTKEGGGIRQDTSIHLWFDQDTMAFRFIMRVAGQPWWNTAITARDGSATYSAFVTLDERT